MTYERIRYDDHVNGMQWRQGEHVFIAGPTGSGKSTIVRQILDKRGHVLGFGTKVHDDTIRKEYSDYSFVEKMSDIEGWMNRVILWPRLKRKESGEAYQDRQRVIFRDAFDKIFSARGWCVYVDELNYMVKYFNLSRPIESLHYIGRSSGISMVTLAQRPAYVPLAVVSNASHAYIAQTKLGPDAKRLADLGNIDPKEVTRTLASLDDRHDFLYLPTLGQGTPGIVNTRK